jgi:hypothetical protein
MVYNATFNNIPVISWRPVLKPKKVHNFAIKLPSPFVCLHLDYKKISKLDYCFKWIKYSDW